MSNERRRQISSPEEQAKKKDGGPTPPVRKEIMISQNHHSPQNHPELTTHADVHVERCSECDGTGEIVCSETLVGYYVQPPTLESYSCQTCRGAGEIITVLAPEGVTL